MNVKRLIELLSGFDDETEIMIRNSFNVCGNISELRQVEKSNYGFFGVSVPCIILNTYHSVNGVGIEDEEGNSIDYIESIEEDKQ